MHYTFPQNGSCSSWAFLLELIRLVTPQCMASCHLPQLPLGLHLSLKIQELLVQPCLRLLNSSQQLRARELCRLLNREYSEAQGYTQACRLGWTDDFHSDRARFLHLVTYLKFGWGISSFCMCFAQTAATNHQFLQGWSFLHPCLPHHFTCFITQYPGAYFCLIPVSNCRKQISWCYLCGVWRW